MATETAELNAAAVAPAGNVSGESPIIVVDLGKRQRRRQIKRLRRGEGRLIDKVQDAVGELRESGRVTGQATIVVVVREKEKNRCGFRF